MILYYDVRLQSADSKYIIKLIAFLHDGLYLRHSHNVFSNNYKLKNLRSRTMVINAIFDVKNSNYKPQCYELNSYIFT